MSSTFLPAGGLPAPVCRRCQTPLSPGETVCSKCGYQNVPINTPNAQNQSPSGVASASKKGLLQQYGVAQQRGAAPAPVMPPMQPANNPNLARPSGSNVVSAPQSGTGYPSLPKTTNNLSSFKPNTGQLTPAQPNPAYPGPQPGSGANLPPFRPANGQPAPNTGPRPANGQLPTTGGQLPTAGTQSRPASGQLAPNRPGQPAPSAFQQQGSVGYPAQYGMPPQARTTGSFSNAPSPMAPPVSRPMPSMPVPTPSMAHRAQPGARRPLNSQQDDNPNWARLAIIVTLLAVLAVGGYLGVTKLSGAGKNTSQVQPTPTSSYQPTGTPLFTDNFAANTYGWNLQSDEGNFSATIGGNSLTLQNNTHKLLWELLPGTRSYDNFEMAFDATLTKGDPNNGYGIYIRGASNNNTDLANYYRFELYGDGSYAIFKGATDAAGNTTDTRLVTYTGDSAINKVGKVNHVLIIANASKLTFIVNNQMLKTLTDTSYVSGTIAFFASNLAEAKSGATVQFANLVIYPAPGK